MRTAELIRTIDVGLLGERLRLARLAAGMTQVDVAGGEVSAAYISRIEAGQRRPETKLLERMAGRLGVELSTLLEEPVDQALDEFRVRLDHAELMLMSGEPQAAMNAVEELRKSDAFVAVDLLRRAKQLQALASEALGQSDVAIKLLEELVADPLADVSWVRAIIALSRCYRESGDFARAIAVGERATDLIDELQLAGTTEAIQLTVTVAGAYLERGDLAQALAMCQRCIEDSERVHSPVAKASAYWNASVIESMRGNAGSALDLAQKAMSLFELGEDSRNLGRLRTQVAYMQMIQDPPDAHAARRSLELAERELAWSSASQVDRARHQLMAGKAAFLLGELEAAADHATKTRDLAAGQSPILVAESLALAGQIRAAEGHLDAARESYQQAVRELTGVGIDRDVARLWFDLAGLLERDGDSAGALDAYRRGATATGLADVGVVAKNAPAPRL